MLLLGTLGGSYAGAGQTVGMVSTLGPLGANGDILTLRDESWH
jgi:hypothetical protein